MCKTTARQCWYQTAQQLPQGQDQPIITLRSIAAPARARTTYIIKFQRLTHLVMYWSPVDCRQKYDFNIVRKKNCYIHIVYVYVSWAAQTSLDWCLDNLWRVFINRESAVVMIKQCLLRNHRQIRERLRGQGNDAA